MHPKLNSLFAMTFSIALIISSRDGVCVFVVIKLVVKIINPHTPSQSSLPLHSREQRMLTHCRCFREWKSTLPDLPRFLSRWVHPVVTVSFWVRWIKVNRAWGRCNNQEILQTRPQAYFFASVTNFLCGFHSANDERCSHSHEANERMRWRAGVRSCCVEK